MIGDGNLLGDEDLRNALYTIDIGQNDLDGIFSKVTNEKAILKIPDIISEIENVIKVKFSEFVSLLFF